MRSKEIRVEGLGARRLRIEENGVRGLGGQLPAVRKRCLRSREEGCPPPPSLPPSLTLSLSLSMYLSLPLSCSSIFLPLSLSFHLSPFLSPSLPLSFSRLLSVEGAITPGGRDPPPALVDVDAEPEPAKDNRLRVLDTDNRLRALDRDYRLRACHNNVLGEPGPSRGNSTKSPLLRRVKTI